MKTVECPKCALRFEAGDPHQRSEVFCPQCGNIFETGEARRDSNKSDGD